MTDYENIRDAIEEGVYHALKRMFDKIMWIATITWFVYVGIAVIRYWLHK